MTSEAITEFVRERGSAISAADLATVNDMLIDLPLDEVSDVRAWVMEGIALTVNDPLYEGDIPAIE
jgi:hypothetical protein